MKNKFLLCLNALLGVLLSMVGYLNANAQRVMAKYGVPSADVSIKGKVTDESRRPVGNVQVVVRDGIRASEDTIPVGKCGRYKVKNMHTWPVDTMQMYVVDPSGKTVSDTVKAPVRYKNNGNGFYRGTGKVNANIQVKRK